MNMTTPEPLCRRCGYVDPDIRLMGCSCLLHARCIPMSLVIAEGAPYQYGGIPTPVKSNAVPCPICLCGTVTGIQLLPMVFSDLERAVDLRKQSAQAAATAAHGGKRSRDEHDAEDSLHQHIQAESSYLLLSHAKAPGSRNHQNDRTGRWSAEEVAYVDQVVTGFDQGSLPLPHGVKLNEFLGDMLLCKSSRLTKKMKNAKLSTRSFTLKNTCTSLDNQQVAMLSSLQDKFLKTVPSEPMQLELKFNMAKLWRTHFSNLCLQVGYDLLDGSDWLLSLEEMERRASDADEIVRAARRRRMGMALRQDVGPTSNAGVFIGGVPANRGTIITPPPPVTFSSDIVMTTAAAAAAPPIVVKSTPMTKPETNEDPVDFLAHVLDISSGLSRPRTLSEDFLIGFDYLVEDPLNVASETNANIPPPVSSSLSDCGPFLENVIQYMESMNLAFEHADVWVPSILPAADENDTSNNLRLFHAGHATRSDIDASISFKLHEYGIYSTNFSFAPGVGLPGRVYASGKPSWEDKVDMADPSRFERAGGAQVYGVKTAIGIPMDTAVVGRIVLALYTTKDIVEDVQELEGLATEFAKWTPEPKWKLVVELGERSDVNQSQAAVTAQMVTSNDSVAKVSSSSLAPSLSTPISPNEMKHETMESGPTPPVKDDSERRIASLLGDHMPLTEDSGSTSMLPHFMFLRLLLLRSEDRRSQEENERLDVVKSSFQGYSKDNKRTDADLAWLLARDWMFLSASQQQQQSAPPVTTAPTTHQSHTLSPTSQQIMPVAQQPMCFSYPSMGALNISGENISVAKLTHWCHDSSDPEPVSRGEVSPTVVEDNC